MKTNRLLATTFLATALIAAPVFGAHAESVKTRVVSEKVTRTVKPLAITHDSKEVKPAVQRFVELINQARVDIALKKPQDAQPRLDNALKMARFIRDNSTVQETYSETRISSGLVTYKTADTVGSYYVPFETGPVEVKTMAQTPSSKSNPGVAVTGTDIVYLTVDLSGPSAETYIPQAKAALKQGDLKAADQSLAQLMDEVVKTEQAERKPYDTAQDNLTLALQFLRDNNYSAAQYALTHAADAVKEIEGSDGSHYGRITRIRDMVMQENANAAQKARTQIIAAKGEIKDLRS